VRSGRKDAAESRGEGSFDGSFRQILQIPGVRMFWEEKPPKDFD